MAVAPDAAAPSERRRWDSAADNPLIRAFSRVPLPLGGKLLVGFALVAGLVAVAVAVGLVALSQSNSRGEQLQRLQARAVYVQLLQTEAAQLKHTIDDRLNSIATPTRQGDLPIAELWYASAQDQAIGNEFTRLCLDAGSGVTVCNLFPPHLPLTLEAVAPSLHQKLESAASLFFTISGSAGFQQGSIHPVIVRADRRAAFLAEKLGVLAQKTRAQADALVAANRSSFASSRNLLIGVGAGSLALALILVLLLSLSLVAPLRRTQTRLAAIAGGDFSGHLDVANRDEIGALAADVNRMNDELGRLYQELETASRHKSDFLATMSHELRTPLNAIIGFSEVLQEQMFGELNERQLAYINDVLEAGRHLLSLINDVLDLAKIEAGRMDLELSEVAIPEVLRSAVSIHSERAARGGMVLALSSEPEEIVVTADERRVRQIVFNLLSNAVKFTPADGRIDVSAQLQNGQVEIAVADTGPGIAATDLESIFEEFEQTSEGKQMEGTGLGLPLSRKLVELHGGRLWAESQPGHGSTFRFTLPTRQEAAS
jgi:signal transduction histidine kinase